jgi:protein-S-isoprenylcysteine O-methyltransferase Ste14
VKTQDSSSSQDVALRAEFHRQYDVSYLAPDLPRPPLKQALKHYLASALVYGSVLLLYTINPWFRNLLSGGFVKGWPALRMYYYFYAAYLVVCPLVIFPFRPRSLWVSKNIRIVGYIWRVARSLLRPTAGHGSRDLKPSYEEKHALMFLLIKIIYAPWMISSFMNEYNGVSSVMAQYHRWIVLPLVYRLDAIYELVYHGVFILDSAVFALGYHWESGFLKNKLRYAETNVGHILVCVACYGPFNLATGQLFGTSNQSVFMLWRDNPMHPATWVLRGFGVLFLLLLLSSSLSMCTRASNLTNRGIVTWGPYAIVRHPGYFAKNMFWLLTLIPLFVPNTHALGFTWSAYVLYHAWLIWGFLGWGMLYFLRAITEERLLMRDPDYVAYCKKVRYRFIPGVY